MPRWSPAMWTHELLTPPPSISFPANLETPQAGRTREAGRSCFCEWSYGLGPCFCTGPAGLALPLPNLARNADKKRELQNLSVSQTEEEKREILLQPHKGLTLRPALGLEFQARHPQEPPAPGSASSTGHLGLAPGPQPQGETSPRS